MRKNFVSEAGDSRSGLLTALAEWATQKTNSLRPQREVRSWRPDLLVPMTMTKDIRSSFKLMQSIVYPKGSVKILYLKSENDTEHAMKETFLQNVVKKFNENDLMTAYTTVDNTDFNTTINISMQSLHAAFFKPNIVFVSVDTTNPNLEIYDRLLLDAKRNHFGVIIYIPFSTASLAIEKNINLWLTEIPADWKETFSVHNNDLSALISILMCRNWKGSIDAYIVNNNPALTISEDDVDDFRVMARFPKNTTITVKQGDLLENVKQERNTDVNILSVQPTMTVAEMVDIVNESRISAIFCADSEFENVMV